MLVGDWNSDRCAAAGEGGWVQGIPPVEDYFARRVAVFVSDKVP
jgi:hypothetical protein